MQVLAHEHLAFEDEDPELDDSDWYEELNDPSQLKPWKLGEEGKGILHTDGSITTWDNQSIHHQPVERFLAPLGKRTKVFLDFIHPDGTVMMEQNAAPEDYEAVRADGMKPVNMDSDESFDFENFDLGEQYVGLND
jgi:hypothetical protein